jgi:hypothetical protein
LLGKDEPQAEMQTAGRQKIAAEAERVGEPGSTGEAMVDAAAEPEAARGRKAAALAPDRDSGFAPSPPTTAAPTLEKGQPAGAGVPVEGAAARGPESPGIAGREQAQAAPPMERADAAGVRAFADGPATSRAVELPLGVASPGLSVIDRPEAWAELLRGEARVSLVTLGEPDPWHRLVLLGRETGIDCSTVSIERGDGGYVVGFGDGASAGCAFVLPRDGLAVFLDR